jgi:glycosyltransferase involved in cell wall biosynthesis
LRERIKYSRQLATTAISMLVHAGPLATAKQLIAWLRGNRRYYRPQARHVTAPQSRVHRGRMERLLRRFSQTVFPTTGITYLVPLVGSPAELEHQAFELIRKLNRWAADHPEHEIILIPDGKLWAHVAKGARSPVRVLTGTDEQTESPARLFNLGLQAATKPCVACGLIGVDADDWLVNSQRLAKSFTPDSVGVAGLRGEGELRRGAFTSHRVRWLDNGYPDPRYGLRESPSGWLEMLDLVPIHNSLLNRAKLIALGGFSEVAGQGFWWQACIALARQGRFTEVDLKPPKSRYTLENYPLQRPGLPIDTVARMAVRYYKPEAGAALYCDLPEVQPQGDDVGRATPPPMRVTILSGPFEPHHNQIFFYNIFRRIEGQGILSWRVSDDEYATPHDIERADLVIYSRVRSDNGRKLLDYARHLSVPVLYMLDDNWFTMGQEWREYKDLIVAGKPFYDNALYCIQNADAVVTYSPVLKSYLEAHARHIFLQTMPVDLSVFPDVRADERRGFIIGYAGSPRQGDTALLALVELARRHADVTVFYFGWDTPEILREIPAAQLIVLQGTHSYADYARRLGELAPDIGFAPLEQTETDRSKNPTKYLDYAAVKCAGVYSAVAPYTAAVSHRETGWLTRGETVEDWVEAAEAMMADRTLLDKIRRQAYEDVAQTYEVGVVAHAFVSMLRQVHGRAF